MRELLLRPADYHTWLQHREERPLIRYQPVGSLESIYPTPVEMWEVLKVAVTTQSDIRFYRQVDTGTPYVHSWVVGEDL